MALVRTAGHPTARPLLHAALPELSSGTPTSEGPMVRAVMLRVLVLLFMAVAFAAAAPALPAFGQTAAACDDGVDNDGDGRIDLDDPGCHGKRMGTDETDPPPVPS